MAYLALVSAVEGRRVGLAATAGVALGLLIIGLAAAFGLAAIINTSPMAFAVLRWGGAAYIAWLAIEAWRGSSEVSPERAVLDAGAGLHFKRGLIINLLNPKAGLFFIAVLPGFINPAANVVSQTVFLTGLYVGLATVVHLLLVFSAAATHRWFADPERQKNARRVFSVMLAAVAGWFIFSTR